MFFEISKDVFDKIPSFVCGVVAVRGIDNSREVPAIREMLEKYAGECKAYFDASGNKAKDDPCVAPYREVFKEIGINPNRYACAIEALMDRIAKGKGMPSINPAVDLGNAISLKYRIPIGAHDMNTFLPPEGERRGSGDSGIIVRASEERDHFLPFGAPAGEFDDPEDGEIVYASANEIRTRRWIWRQSEVGKMTENTTAVFYPIDGLVGVNEENIKEAIEEFKGLLAEFFGGSANFCVQSGMVDRDNPRIEFWGDIGA
ncbi:MAG: hypothetical protein IKE52_04930 [Mogibacterium sp.]|nr:hypothetical protein [Mogibacterium sp.]